MRAIYFYGDKNTDEELKAWVNKKNEISIYIGGDSVQPMGGTISLCKSDILRLADDLKELAQNLSDE